MWKGRPHTSENMLPDRVSDHMEEVLSERYLYLVKLALTRKFDEAQYDLIPQNSRTIVKRLRYAAYAVCQKLLRPYHLAIVQTNRPTGETMMGMGALNNLHACLDAIRIENTPGDLVETGVWRGGGVIFMRAFLAAHGDRIRRVWACDSFQGLPKPSGNFSADRDSRLWQSEYLAVDVERVKANFAKYGLLDDRTVFLKGFFSETMASAPISQIAVLRLDGDMYESTIVVLEALYQKVSRGGFIIVDDYGMIPACNQAVEDFRRAANVTEPLKIIGYVDQKPLGAFWRKL
jgi:O-methyltransferase